MKTFRTIMITFCVLFMAPASFAQNSSMESKWESMPECISGTAAFEKEQYTTAITHFRKAQGKGNVLAVIMLAIMYADGKGVEQNYTEAANLYKQAIESGQKLKIADHDIFVAAMLNLAAIYTDADWQGKDYAAAMLWNKKAAATGSALAMNNIGALYYEGKGVERSYPDALIWFKKAAGKGEIAAVMNVANLYYDGPGDFKQNYEEAFKWFAVAANKGNIQAIKKSAEMLENGQGTQKDPVTAKKLREAAYFLENRDKIAEDVEERRKNMTGDELQKMIDYNRLADENLK